MAWYEHGLGILAMSILDSGWRFGRRGLCTLRDGQLKSRRSRSSGRQRKLR